MKKIIPLCLMLLGTSAFAATTTANTQASAKLESMCQIISASSINFGLIGNTETNTTSPLVLKCTKGTTYSIYSNTITETTPNTAGLSLFAHKMTGATPGNDDILGFNIFNDSGYTNIISGGETAKPAGRPSHQTYGISGTGTGENFTHTLYVRQYGIRNNADPARSFVRPDIYSGTVTLTLTY